MRQSKKEKLPRSDEEYKRTVVRRLAEMIPVLQKAALGDFSGKIKIPEKEDEFTELLVALDLMLGDLREIARSQAERYKAVIDAALDGFWIAAAKNGRFLEVNDSYCRMLGYSRGELLKMKISDVEAAEKPAEVAAHIKKVARTGGDCFETRQRRQDGKILELSLCVSYLKEGGCMAAFAHDVTERKKTEDELKKRTAEMEKMNRFMIGREIKIKELKDELKRMKGD